MLTVAELREISAARIEEAQALLDAGHYDGVVYLCGYAVELALKARICETLNWAWYPSNNREFKDLHSFRTHNLNVLLWLSGQDSRIRSNMPDTWKAVSTWNPELRYQIPGSATLPSAALLLEEVRRLLGTI